MRDIEFSQDQKDKMVHKIKAHFDEELQQDIGSFEAEFLIEFFVREIGPYCYNRGLFDAQQVFSERMEELSYLLQELEQPEN